MKESSSKVAGLFLTITSPILDTFTRFLARIFRKVCSTSTPKHFSHNSYIFGKSHPFRTFEENIIFPCTFWERSSFIFRLKNKIIFSGKRNLIFPGDARNTIFQVSFLERPSFQSTRKKKIWFFVQWQIKNGEKISILAYGIEFVSLRCISYSYHRAWKLRLSYR